MADMRSPLKRSEKQIMPKTDKLTPKEERFKNEYLIDLNGGAAYLRAGYRAKNGNVARVQASRLLAKPNVKAAIEARMKELQEKTGVTQEMVVKELALLAFSNMQNYASFGPNGVSLKDSSEMSKEQLAAVAEVSETTTKEGGSTRFKLHDKKGSLELLGKHLGMFVEKHEVTGKNGLPLQVFIGPGPKSE
jgi:phage terminase small subunit